MSATASPLDQNPTVCEFVRDSLQNGGRPSEIVAELENRFGVITTKDSIRRFRERHSVKVKTAEVIAKDTESTSEPSTPAFQYSIIEQGDDSCITVFAPGKKPLVADSSHPNFRAIVEKALSGDLSVLDLFDVEETLRRSFDRLSDRVLVRDGRIYFDGDEIHNAITEHILRFLDEDGDEWEPLVLFLEKILANPVQHSREQLYSWLGSHRFSITPDGDIIAYKGVEPIDDEAASYRSLNGGYAIVDGEEVNGKVPQNLGSIVEMPRQRVMHDPSQSCSAGLHIGTFPYASHYGSVVLEVHVNPRDVVSVPNGEAEKARTCRYVVIDEVEAPYEAAIVVPRSGRPVEDCDLPDEEDCDHCSCYYDGGDNGDDFSCCECGEDA